MQMEKFFQTMKDGTEIAVNRWGPDEKENAKAVIVLSHGMLEHALRYDRTGSIFAESGYVFSAHDHRGHGRTALTAEQKGKGQFGLLAKRNGFNKVVSDLAEVLEKAKADFPGKKIILLGHSFGSFVAQSYIENYTGVIDGVILCGSSGPNPQVKKGKALVKVVSTFRSPEYKSKFVQNQVFKHYLDRVEEKVESGYEWLSKDKTNVYMYQNDNWCGGIACLGFFRDLFKGLSSIHRPSAMKKVPVDLPVFIISGSEDPVSDYGKSVTKLSEIYKKNGVKSVELKLYEGDRHEILNEADSDKVVEDIQNWITGTVLA